MVTRLILVAALLMAGCQTAPKGTFCALAEAQRPSQEAIDKLSDEQVAALLRHNRLGGKLCGWRP
jgi:starvation-inducible outer membrane lipoprotein